MWKRLDVPQNLDNEGLASQKDAKEEASVDKADGVSNIRRSESLRGTRSIKTEQQRKKHKMNIARTSGSKNGKANKSAGRDPSYFRLFVGNLGEDVTTNMLEGAFKKYPSLAKAKVVLDNRNQKSRGYGFVAFKDASDYLRAFQEMNKKYIGRQPVILKRAQSNLT